jgi:chromosome segregation ATPase
MPPRSGGSASIQVLRLELEHQLERNRELAEQLEAQQRAAVEHARALRHQIVDLEADLDLRNTSAEALATKLAGLQSAFDAYGDVLTQEVGPQDTSGA